MRSGISIVPQSPDLFEGTIRENIDPTGVSQDADIWVALEQVRAPACAEGPRTDNAAAGRRTCGSLWRSSQAGSTLLYARVARRCLRDRGSCCALRERCCGRCVPVCPLRARRGLAHCSLFLQSKILVLDEGTCCGRTI